MKTFSQILHNFQGVRCNGIDIGFNCEDFMPAGASQRVGDEYIIPDPEIVTAKVKHIEHCLNAIVFFAADNLATSFVSGAILPIHNAHDANDGVVNVLTI